MKVVGLYAENVKRLKAVELKVDTQGGGLVVISGRNRQGKSSLLDSIAYALGGKRLIPDEPIRKGTKAASVQVTLDGEDVEHGPWTVSRTFSKTGAYLKIENAAGLEFSSPQQLLDTFLGDFSFDPLAFLNLKPKEQREALLQTVDLELDLDDVAAKHGALFGKRRDANRDVKRLEGALAEAVESPEGTPDEEVSLADLTAELQGAHTHNAHIRELVDAHEGQIKEAARLHAQIEKLDAQHDAARVKAAGYSEKLQGLNPTDTEAIDQRIAEAEQTNASVRQKRAREQLQGDLAKARKQSKGLTANLQALIEQRDSALEAAEFPVEGLSVDEETVTYNGVALAEAAQSEQLKVSVGIAMSLSPRLRIVRIKDGSLLDTRSMEDLDILAREHDFDIWIERVSDGQKVGVVIEDGEAVYASEREGVEILNPSTGSG